MKQKIFVTLVGAEGKMGRAIEALLESDPEFGEITKVDQQNHLGLRQHASLNEVCGPDPGIFSILINFSSPQGTKEAVAWCKEYKVPLLNGTTGLSPVQVAMLKALSKTVPVLNDYNLSTGVNLIDSILPGLAKKLAGLGWDFEMCEAHHRRKKDSPSGTAERFAKTLASATGRKVVYGRKKGHTEQRDDSIVVHSIRGGNIPGEHEIRLIGPDEEIVISHYASSNKIFAMGAVEAAKWLVDQKPGLYTMLNVLGLKK